MGGIYPILKTIFRVTSSPRPGDSTPKHKDKQEAGDGCGYDPSNTARNFQFFRSRWIKTRLIGNRFASTGAAAHDAWQAHESRIRSQS